MDSGSGGPKYIAIPSYCTALDDQPRNAEAKAVALLHGIRLPTEWALHDHDAKKTLGHINYRQIIPIGSPWY